ncbi:MAG: hypothetical protein KC620_05155 [Myxococcales bacterium]|nr:hypothetical protein [Myxococcales bacterium]
MRRAAMARWLAWTAVATALWACDDGGSGDGGPPVVIRLDGDLDMRSPDAETPDSAVDDMGPADVAPVDMAPADAEPPDAAPPPGLCDACGEGGACGPGGLCLTNQNTMESFCGTPCEGDADCPRGATCFELGDGTKQCVPNGGTCEGFPPSDLGAACADDSQCAVGADRCIAAGPDAYCSVGCADDGDCPPGYDRCRAGVCRAVFELTPEGCGRDPSAPLPPCGSCGAGLSCATDLFESLPAPIAPFCTRLCNADADCPEGAACLPIADGRSICLSPACECLARPTGQNLLDTTLGRAGVNRCTAGFSRATFDLFRPEVAHDPFRLSWYDPAHRYAYGGLKWARGVQRDLAERAESAAPAARLIEAGAALLDAPISPREGAFDAAGDTPLADALAGVWTATGTAGFDRAATTAALAAVPLPLRRDLGRVVQAMVAVHQARDQAFAAFGLPVADQQALFDLLPSAMITRPDFTAINMRNRRVQELLAGGLDLSGLFAAARDVAATIEGIDWAAHAGAEGFAVDLQTPLGRLVIADAGAQTLEGDGPFFLVVDTGGDDTYLAPVAATTSAAHSVSVLIEIAGSDVYGYPGYDAPSQVADLPPADAAGRYDGSHPDVGDQFGPMSLSTVARQGAGILGAGLAFDLAGDDRYSSLKLSQGAGVLGVGLLVDRAGSDDYRCEQGCQGAAAYGLGVLVDRGVARDRYLGVQSVQGFGYVRGVGYLHDEAGDDDYRALQGDAERGGVMIYPNSQNAGRSNTSLAQGAGFGRRADFGDQVFASGGLGAFRDGAGDDHYTVDIFGQGTGFWFGTGLFSDGGGDDVYEGRWYNQGSGAHYAMSYFFEDGGNDTYNRPETILATAVGQGHDMSLGWFIDAAGNDEYVAPGLGMGAGNDNGIGFFLELGGDDIYHAPDARTFGGAAIGDRGAAFDEALCLGIFIDADGTDTYESFAEDALVGESRAWRWSDRHADHKPGERGAGVDATGAVIRLP